MSTYPVIDLGVDLGSHPAVLAGKSAGLRGCAIASFNHGSMIPRRASRWLVNGFQSSISGVDLPSVRPAGRFLLVGRPICREAPLQALRGQGVECAEATDPYQAMVRFAREPGYFSSVILSLNSLYREELQVITALKQRYPSLEIWLCDTDGRHVALADAIRLGASGIVDSEGFHDVARDPESSRRPPFSSRAAASHGSAAISGQTEPQQPSSPVSHSLSTRPALHPRPPESDASEKPDGGDPLLTAEELRALLQDVPGVKGNG